MNNKTVSKLTYIMPPHHHVEAQMQQSKTITNMEKHEQEEPIKTIATKTITNTTGSVRELDLAMCVSPSSNGSKMRSLWTNQMKS